MAPLNPNNTDRLKVFYQNSQAEHIAMIRLVAQDGLAEAQTVFTAVTTALDVAYSFSEVTAVQIALEGADIFLDVPGATLIGYTWGSDPATEESNATALTFVGRSSTGRRARFALFGYKNALSEYRLTSAESEGIEDSVAAMQGAADSFFAIDGNTPVWKTYANVKAYDHWVDVARNG